MTIHIIGGEKPRAPWKYRYSREECAAADHRPQAVPGVSGGVGFIVDTAPARCGLCGMSETEGFIYPTSGGK